MKQPGKHMEERPQVIVAGHICIDMIPRLPSTEARFQIEPGSLMSIGPARFSAGGAVGNVGLALHRLGVRTGLMGKVGNDQFGQALLSMMRSHDPALAEAMIISNNEPTSYSIVIEPPGIDRAFMHCSGANDTLVADDFDAKRWEGAKLFHFGYPPIMPSMHASDGEELVKLFKRVKEDGLITSLDMCSVDPSSPAGRVDWRKLLENVLPHVDLFVPSYVELAWMIGKDCASESDETGRVAASLEQLSTQVLAMGAGAVAIKVGEKGLYLRTKENCALGPNWSERELWHPCYQVNVVGTTGSGDCTVAGLLTAILNQLPPDEALPVATGVGACSVEDASATAGVPTYAGVWQRINKGWTTRAFGSTPDRWRAMNGKSMIAGPNDKAN
ncbi:MAG: carbohydrate kinase family protein [Phycisphaerales bacterium]